METYPKADAPVPPPEPPPRKRRRHRWIAIVGWMAFLTAALVIVAPTLISTSWVRQRLIRSASDRLGVRVAIEDLGFSWFSGISLQGLRIDNPEGFPDSHPAVELRSLRGDLSLLQLLRGRLDLTGKVDGLRARVDQNADGRTNLQRLFGGRLDAVRIDSGEIQLDPGDADSDVLGRLRLDLDLTDGLFELSRDGQVLESLRNLNGSIHKEFDSSVVRADLSVSLHKPGSPDHPGSLQLHADIDAESKRIDGQLTTAGLDLGRYGPLLAAFLQPDQIRALEGVMNGTVQVRILGSDKVLTEGSLTIDAPRIAGDLLRGMDVRAERWTLRPNLQLRLGGEGMPEVDASNLFADFGFLQLQGLGAADAEALLQDEAGLAVRYTVDLDALAAFGGPLPAELQGSGGAVSGSLGLPLDGGALPGADEILAGLRTDAEVQLSQLGVQGFRLAGLRGSLAMRQGRLQLEAGNGATLNSGPLELRASLDLTDRQRLPLQFSVQWDRGELDAAAVPLFRYAVPLLAGLGEGAEFRSQVGLRLQLGGPALPDPGETVLQWLDHWAGSGELQLAGGTLTPASALQAILELTGQERVLALDELRGSFEIAQGFVQTRLLEWQSKGAKYGLSGRTGLDGTLDWQLDLSPILQRRRDGQKILAALKGAKLTASLQGSLQAPTFAPPDLGKLLQSGVEGALQDVLKDALKGKDPQSELQRQLDKLFGRGKKKDPDDR